MTILTNPWKHLDAKENEWLFSEDSYINSFKKGEPERVLNNCVYVGVKKNQPVYSIANSKEPAGFHDIAVFTTIDGKDYTIAKRIVDREGKGKWKVNDWFTLSIRGCCNIVKIVKE